MKAQPITAELFMIANMHKALYNLYRNFNAHCYATAKLTTNRI